MEPNIQNSSGMMNGMPPVPKQTRKVGPIIGALVIVLIIIIIALYFFGQRVKTTPSTIDSVINTTNNSASVSSSSEVKDLNADLDAQLKDVDYSF